MINQLIQNEKIENKFSYTIKELEIEKVLRKSNVVKNCGILKLAIMGRIPSGHCAGYGTQPERD